MTGHIEGFVSRSDAGLVKPTSVSKRFTPELGGVVLHYGGGAQSAAKENADHSQCISTWRSWQKYHMSKNWVDIAYTGGFCNHGYAFAGRGKGVRTAANGTNESNKNYYGIVWIGGEGQTPTQEAFRAAMWWVDRLRSDGDAGDAVKPHSWVKSTGCPGPALTDKASQWDDEVLKDDDTKPENEQKPEPTPTTNIVRKIQKALDVVSDGKWGPKTDARALRMRRAASSKRGWPSNRSHSFNVRDVQSVIGTKVDGIWGPLSQAALIGWIKGFQETINVSSDGLWGPKTDGKFVQLRRRYLNKY